MLFVGAVFFLMFSGVIVAVFIAFVCIALVGIAAVALGIGGGIAAANMRSGQAKSLLGRLCVIAVLLGAGCLLLLKFLSMTGLIIFLLAGAAILILSLGGKKQAALVEHRGGRIVALVAFFCGIFTGVFMALCSVIMLALGAQ